MIKTACEASDMRTALVFLEAAEVKPAAADFTKFYDSRGYDYATQACDARAAAASRLRGQARTARTCRCICQLAAAKKDGTRRCSLADTCTSSRRTPYATRRTLQVGRRVNAASVSGAEDRLPGTGSHEPPSSAAAHRWRVLDCRASRRAACLRPANSDRAAFWNAVRAAKMMARSARSAGVQGSDPCGCSL